MRVLTLNCGSSSIKAALVDTSGGDRLLDVRVENLESAADQDTALERVLAEVRKLSTPLAAVGAVAHRIVHGGTEFVEPRLIDDAVLNCIGALQGLAPLHNPAALATVAAARKALPGVPHIAFFDTAFHATLPRRAREYALPVALTQRLGIRRFGFHGISHGHVMEQVARHLKTQPQTLRIISCHLGNGASVAAIEYGRSVETSMGMTPLEGLVMGTRGGDLDPGVLLQLLQTGEYDSQALSDLLNSGAGLKGLTGTHDMREIERRAATGDESCRLAIGVYAHRVRKYVGAYAAIMGGVDVIAFTGGVGENSPLIRHRIAQRLDFLGAPLDEDRNRDARLSRVRPIIEISADPARTRILVVQADEEAAMAVTAARLLETWNSEKALPGIPVNISARHAHLGQPTLDQLFGVGYRLRCLRDLEQPGQFAAEETVTLVGPHGRIENVRVLGPPRDRDQVEISRSDEFVLGIDAPVRVSGDIANTPGIVLEGPRGRAILPSGVICARRHIHMHPDDAVRFGLKDHDSVAVRVDSDGRDLVFGDVTVRVSPDFRLEMHVDLDEANAAGLKPGDTVRISLPSASP